MDIVKKWTEISGNSTRSVDIPSWGSGPFLQDGASNEMIHGVMSDGEPIVAKFSNGRWQLNTPSVLAQAEAAANPMPPGAAEPLLSNTTYIAPGSLRGFATVGAGGKGYVCDLTIPGISNTFNTIEILGVSTMGDAYNIEGAWIGQAGSTDDVTENIQTGFVTIFNSVKTVSAGGSESIPVFTKLTSGSGFSIGGYLPNSFRLIIQLAEGAELRLWGVPYESVGWDGSSSQHITSTLPSISWDLSSLTASFGSMPNIIIGIKNLTTPVVTVPLIGDSHIQTFGDDGGINGRRGLGVRLSNRWTSEQRAWVPLQLGIQGLPTPSILTLWETITKYLDLRCVVYEGISVNNYNDGYGYQDPGARAVADTLAASHVLEAGSPFWVIIPGTWSVIYDDSTKKTNFRNTINSLKETYAGNILAQSDGGIWDSSTLVWLSTYAFIDNGHFSTDGYDQWESIISSPLASLIEAAS